MFKRCGDVWVRGYSSDLSGGSKSAKYRSWLAPSRLIQESFAISSTIRVLLLRIENSAANFVMRRNLQETGAGHVALTKSADHGIPVMARRREAGTLRVKAVKTRVQIHVRLEAEWGRGQSDRRLECQGE